MRKVVAKSQADAVDITRVVNMQSIRGAGLDLEMLC